MLCSFSRLRRGPSGLRPALLSSPCSLYLPIIGWVNSARETLKLPDERGDPKWFIPIAYAAIGIYLALDSWQRCTNTNNTFPLDDPAARPSQVCRSTHLYPGSFGSVSVACAICLAPAAVVAGAWIGAARTGRKGLYWAGLLIATLLLFGEILLTGQTHLGYYGV